MTTATIPYMATPRDEPISSTHGRASAEALSADAALMHRIGSGDEDALIEAYDRHAETLFGATVRFLGDREAAAEVVQEAFVACWRFAASFDSAAGSLRTWLLQIARNKALDRLRSESRRPKITQLHPSEGGDEALLDPLERLAHRRGGDDGDDPAVLLERGWTRAVVRTALSDLASHEREVVFLAYGDGLSQHEIAERLGVPLGTVKSRTRRGLAHLRQALSNVPGVAPERGITDAAR
jgi:RNA polymerase sigma-70 factor, ECF subfamily